MDAVAQVRSFNRLVSQRTGVLAETFLHGDRPYGPARVLWEIGPDGADVRALRARLGLDSGYLSRLLGQLQRDGLVAVEVSGTDRRVRTATLTPAGMAERAELDSRSDRLAADLLAALEPPARQRLVDAMAEVERLLTAGMVTIEPRPADDPGALACLARYYAEAGRRFGFDLRLARPVAAAEVTPPAGVLLVAVLRGEPVGCGAVKLHDGWAEIKRMWVAEDARGLGLGRRLLRELERTAAEHGRREVRLDTNGAFTEAIALYRSVGYEEVPAFNDEHHADHWFARTVH